MLLQKLRYYLPEVKGPTEKKLDFKTKLKWTGIILVLYFVLGFVPLFGLGENALQQFDFLSIVLGAQFGSIISLGIGPIVTASIILQLLVGAGIIKYDLTKKDDRQKFEALQKIFSLAFIIVQAFIFVNMGGLSPAPLYDPVTSSFVVQETPDTIALTAGQLSSLRFMLIFQLVLGGFLIMLMDEVVAKWGFGSGISLFIAAGVSQQIFIRAFSWIKLGAATAGSAVYPIGAIPTLFLALRSADATTALLELSAIFFTVVVFLLAVYAQAMKIEIPLSYRKVRGYGIRWPLSFIYTSNIPVILTAALFGNLEIFAGLLERTTAAATGGIMRFISIYVLGQVNTVNAGYGIVQWVRSPQLIQNIITGSVTSGLIASAVGYAFLMVAFSVLFSLIWVQTSGMDAKSVAKQITSSGLKIPGFRSDQRILERLLNRYIWPLAFMGAATVGLIAALADLSGALSRGTGILLTVMIIYKMYENITRQHLMEMSPGLRKLMKN
ncbi:MAG TPA: preprotein translocase subunit SecY [Candidatus Woesearchaeota archaeon]|nr:preprotein translocase subunit SecY [Candidatus Woesearchaeota archaeon]